MRNGYEKPHFSMASLEISWLKKTNYFSDDSHSRLISKEVIFVRMVISDAPVAVDWELTHVWASLVSA